MSIWDSMKRMTQPYDDGYDDYDDEGADYEQEPRRTVRAAEPETPVVEYSAPVSTPTTGFSGQIVTGGGRLKSEIHLFQPTAYDEKASEAAKLLVDGKTIHLNVEDTPADAARRIIDFLSGAVFALNGKVTKGGKSIYLFSPNNVEITGINVQDEEN